MYKIQIGWKERILLTKARLELLGNFWDKEKSILIKHYHYKGVIKKNKKAKVIYSNLMQLDNKIKNFMLKIYFEVCKMKFTVAFFDHKLQTS